MFKLNKTLIHVDLGHNNIGPDETTQMAKGLVENHTIFGLHFNGNSGFVDNLGFLTPMNDLTKADCAVLTRIQPTLESGIKSKLSCKLQINSNCWICEGWSQVKFTFSTEGLESASKYDAVKLHLEIDEWKGEQMHRIGEHAYYFYRMLPPGNHRYYYSVSDSVHLDEDEEVVENVEADHRAKEQKQSQPLPKPNPRSILDPANDPDLKDKKASKKPKPEVKTEINVTAVQFTNHLRAVEQTRTLYTLGRC
jgi:hypothetical protein